MKIAVVAAIQMLEITVLVLKGGSVQNFENSDNITNSTYKYRNNIFKFNSGMCSQRKSSCRR